MGRIRPLPISEGAICRPVDNLPICFEDFGGEGRAHVDRWSEIATEHRVVIGECHWLITKHDPVIESKFAELANVGRLAQHHCFWNFPLQDEDIMCSVGTNVGLELDGIRPKGFGYASSYHLPASGLFQFPDGTLGSILPRRVRFGLLDATISILAFLLEPAQGLFL